MNTTTLPVLTANDWMILGQLLRAINAQTRSFSSLSGCMKVITHHEISDVYRECQRYGLPSMLVQPCNRGEMRDCTEPFDPSARYFSTPAPRNTLERLILTLGRLSYGANITAAAPAHVERDYGSMRPHSRSNPLFWSATEMTVTFRKPVLHSELVKALHSHGCPTRNLVHIESDESGCCFQIVVGIGFDSGLWRKSKRRWAQRPVSFQYEYAN